MAHALEMYFDDQAEAAVRRPWQLLADAGLPSLATRTHRLMSWNVTASDAHDLGSLCGLTTTLGS